MTTVIPHGGTRMTRWTVRKEHGMFWDEDDELCDGPRWHVTSPTGVSWGNYATHTEAMSRADRMARTITVTLPREFRAIPLPECVQKEEKALTLTRWNDFIIVETSAQGSGQNIFVHDDELEPLALALLAHARKEQQ